MAKLKSFEEYIIDGDSAVEIEKDMVAMGEPKAAGDGEEVQADAPGAEEVEDETKGEEAGEEVEDMDGPESEGEQDMKVDGVVVDTEPQDKSDEIEDQLEDPEEMEMEVEEGNAFSTARLKAIEAGEDEFEFDGKTYPVKNVDADDKEAAKDMVGEDATESEEEAEEEAEAEEVKEKDAIVADMMKEMYEACKNEAKVWEDDMHDEHTIETYMCENAALAAALAVQSLKEMKEDMTLEMYEAACESLKESYSKKIDEMKEAYASEGEEVEVED